MPFDSRHDCLRFAGVQMLAKFSHTGLVFHVRYYQPVLRSKLDRGRQIPLGCRQFLEYGRGNEYLSIKQGQEFKTSYSREIEDGRRVGDDD